MAAVLLLLIAPLAACSGGGGSGPPKPPPDAAGPGELLIAFDREGELYILDPNTGVDTLKLDTNFGGEEIRVVSSALYVSEAGQLWLGIGGAGNPPCPACVMSLDPATGNVTMLSPSDMKGLASMARSPAGGFIYAANGNSNEFWGIDPTTGVPQRIASFSEGVARGGGMVFDRGGTLWAALDRTLYRVDPGTAATTRVQDFTYTGFPVNIGDGAINSMALLGDTIYGLMFDRNDPTRATYLVRIDTATATVTHVNRNSSPMEGLAVVPGNLLP